MSFLLTLLNSELGQAMILSGALWLWRRATKGDRQRARALDLMQEAWSFAEAVGLTEHLAGKDKLKRFLGAFFDAVKAELGREPTAAEMQAAKLYAERRSMAAKLARTAHPPGASAR